MPVSVTLLLFSSNGPQVLNRWSTLHHHCRLHLLPPLDDPQPLPCWSPQPQLYRPHLLLMSSPQLCIRRSPLPHRCGSPPLQAHSPHQLWPLIIYPTEPGYRVLPAPNPLDHLRQRRCLSPPLQAQSPHQLWPLILYSPEPGHLVLPAPDPLDHICQRQRSPERWLRP